MMATSGQLARSYLTSVTASSMFDASALSQLSQLKQAIRADKNLVEGVVRGTQGRFGFVVLDDGREAFLPPDEMSRVFPGDRVEICYEEDDKGKLTASLEKLISSTTKDVVGQYIVRGKGHFISTDMPQLSRWIFLPPKNRSNAQADDFLHCRITTHPFTDGKGQAKVVAVLGQTSTAGIEHKITVLKHQLQDQWTDKQQQQADELVSAALNTAERIDATAIPFVTIDSETTRDMDDALHISATTDGWQLQVAIADPGCGISLDSPLGKAALQRGNTAYLPGRAVTMLPEALTVDTYSLVPNEQRPALLFTININRDGSVASFDYQAAIIKSRHKLSYHQVARFLEDGDANAVPADCQADLKTLSACAEARTEYRREHMLLMDERADFELKLNEQWHVDHIECQPRSKAQQVVEESMLVTNACAGETFAQYPNSGIFSAHFGFREDKHADIHTLLNEDFAELAELDFTTREGYRQLIKALQSKPEAASRLTALRSNLQAGLLTTEAMPHLGLGMSYYATVTSPIRRYNDYFNHQALLAIRNNTPLPVTTAAELKILQEQIGKTRQSARDLENWLIRLYMNDKVGELFDGHIFRINPQGFTVKLDSNGVTGFVRIASKEEGFQFDPIRLTLKNEQVTYQLDQPLTVKLHEVNHERRQINFELLDASNPMAINGALATAAAE